MNSITLLLTSIGLSMDACAVSISNGMCFENINGKRIFLSSGAFGLFQALMPILGNRISGSLDSTYTFRVYRRKNDCRCGKGT